MPEEPQGTPPPPARAGLLERLGLHRPELRAWAMYDWANSAVITTINAAVFPVFFATYAMAGQPDELILPRQGLMVTISLVITAVIAPILGTISDLRASKKRFLGVFMGVGIAAVALMFFIRQGDWLLAFVLYAVANIGVRSSFVFYDSLLPHVAREEEVDRVSTAGYALGYVGGGLLLALNLAWIMRPDLFGLPHGEGLTPEEASLPTRLALLSVAVWWLVFALPLFRRVAEPPRVVDPEEARVGVVRASFGRLGATLRDLRRYRNAFLMMLAVLVYADGIGTLQTMAVTYGTQLGFDVNVLIAAILLTQFVGIPAAFAFGWMAGFTGTRNAIFIGIGTYVVISFLGYHMTTERHFLMLAMMVGLVQGGTQALSRSLFSSMIPRFKSGEFFGFFGVVERFAGSIGPLVMGYVALMTGVIRYGILSIIVLFVAGGIILWFVDVEEGQRVARAEEDALLREGLVEGPA
jgi:MFS transporter, UMF1 family